MTGLKDKKREKRPHLGVIFRCCRVYSRIYLNKKGDAFTGWCPKCAAKMEILVSPIGFKDRFFFAD